MKIQQKDFIINFVIYKSSDRLQRSKEWYFNLKKINNSEFSCES